MTRTGILLGASIAAAGLLGLGLVMSPMHAQGGGAPPVYVINVKKVFDSSPRFKAEAEGLKADMQKKEDELRTMQGAVAAKQQQREKFKAAADREQIDKDINELQFQFAQKQRKYRDDLAKAESAAVGAVYRDMSALLADYCKQHKIYLVMRLDEPTTEMSDEMKVMTLMNRQLIYNHPNLDLTDVIADGMKGAGGGVAAPGGGENRK